MPITKACDAVGISHTTIMRWIKAGKRYEDLDGVGGNVYVVFVDAMKKAKAGFITRNMAIIRRAAPRTWTAAAWLLERRLPELFALRQAEQIAALSKEIAEIKSTLGKQNVG